MTRRRDVLALAALATVAGAVHPTQAAAPSGQLTIGVHITLAPTWLDPAETQGIITPFMVLYALHDAVAKPMPQGNPSPSLAESWSAGEDGLSYEFTLRKDAKFHNGEPVTADDVKFSFVLGYCDRDVTSTALRLCVKGLFEKFDQPPQAWSAAVDAEVQ